MQQSIQIQPATREHEDDVKHLALTNHMFQLAEVDGLTQTLRGYFDGTLDGHRWLVATQNDGDVVGAAYYAPEAFGDRVWNLLFMAIDPHWHRGGTGTILLSHIEDSLRAQGEGLARVLIVETSSTDAYANARLFYRARGFDEEARIRDFYGPDDNKVVYWKALTS